MKTLLESYSHLRAKTEESGFTDYYENRVKEKIKKSLQRPIFNDSFDNLQLEFEIETGLAPVDCLITWNKKGNGEQKCLVVEIDGSNHFYGLSKNRSVISRTKYKIFEKAGIPHYTIAYHGYKRLKEKVRDSGEVEVI